MLVKAATGDQPRSVWHRYLINIDLRSFAFWDNAQMTLYVTKMYHFFHLMTCLITTFSYLFTENPNLATLSMIVTLNLNYNDYASNPGQIQQLVSVIAWGVTFTCRSLSAIWGPFYWHGLTLIPAWISNSIHHKLWAEIKVQPLKFRNG